MWAIADRRDTGSAAHEARAARRPVGGARPGASPSGANASPIAAHARHATESGRTIIISRLYNGCSGCPCGNCVSGCSGCACGDCVSGCSVIQRKKRTVEHQMNWEYRRNDNNMDVETCIIGCKANGFSYAGLQKGYVPIKGV